MALTVTSANSIKPAKHYGYHSTPSETFLEAASQTFKKGTPLVFTSGGSTVEEDTSNPLSIVAIAEADASGTTNNPIRATPLVDGQLFEGVLGNGDETDYTLAQTDVGDVYGLDLEGTNLGWFVDKQNTAVLTVKVRVVKLLDPAGTVNGRVFFRFLDFVFDSDAAVASQIAVVNGWKVYAATA